MAVATVPAFNMDAAVGASAAAVSSAVALPGTPASDTVAIVTNLGPGPVACKLGDNTVTVAPNSGKVVMPGQSFAFAIQTGQTHIAVYCCSGPGTSTQLNIATGN